MAAAAVLPPAIAVGVPVALGFRNLAAATALCLLAVVVAAAWAGLASGIAASFVSFVGLNFFFTVPHHTFVVRHAGDLVALLAFLLCALIVGTLLSRTLEERARAERRAMEAQFLSRTTAKLVSGEPFDGILDGFARDLVPLFNLSRCEISTQSGTGTAAAATDHAGGPSITIPLATQSGSFGSLVATRPPGGHAFTFGEVELLNILASQTALAIERTRLDSDLRETRLEAQGNQLRAALFSSVTHDLRTPLSSIKASASGLLAEGVSYNEKQSREMLHTIVEEADHLNQIVGNLLDLARMRSGALVPSKQPLLIEDLIASVLRREQRRMHGITVKTTIRRDLPPLDADPVQIQQVLVNLLENAMRFSPPGGEVHISAARWQDAVRVRVADNGPGIPVEDRTRVFEEFYRRDAGPARGGTGLGLAISKAIVVAHGGKIWAEGSAGGGAALVFELPAATSGSDGATRSPVREEVGR
ncbi:MAG TPA: ATP-binding protein [Actinomycetota bacterium]|jgi:two-component system sensor histidine kinase KdpD